MYVGKSDKVGFVVVGGQGVKSVTDLLYVNCTAERSLLRIVTLELHAVFIVPDTVGCRWRVMALESSALLIAALYV